MKFTERLRMMQNAGAEWWIEGKNATPAIIEALEAAEEIRALWKIDDYRRLPRALAALDVLVEEPKP